MVVYNRFGLRDKKLRIARLKKFLVWAGVCELALVLVLQPFRPVLVMGESMQPTLGNLQVVLAKPIGVEPKRGDVVVVEWSDEKIVKRVAGLGFDDKMPGQPERLRVPGSHVYLLGDNSANSVDSRYFGPIPDKDVKMVVVYPPTSAVP